MEKQSQRRVSVDDVDTSGPPVTFVTAGMRSRAVCGCGWTGRRRLLQASAVVDAQVHCAATGCVPADPLVLRRLS